MKTKVRMIPTLFVVAILGAGAYILLPSIKQTLDTDDGGVEVIVEFTPARRTGKPPIPGATLTDQVTIFLRVGSVHSPPERVLKSPWTPAIIYPSKGTYVEVIAEQFYGKWLYCMVRQHGHKPVEDERSTPGEVKCRYMVV